MDVALPALAVDVEAEGAAGSTSKLMGESATCSWVPMR
jgi:hypothetical protein